MAGMKALVGLACAGSIGMTLVILACALPDYNVWWPFFVVIFYLLAPLPTVLAKRHQERSAVTTVTMDLPIFLTMCLVVSSFALPIVLARSPRDLPAIAWGACYLTLAGNVVVYLTYLGFFLTLYQSETYNSMW